MYIQHIYPESHPRKKLHKSSIINRPKGVWIVFFFVLLFLLRRRAELTKALVHTIYTLYGPGPGCCGKRFLWFQRNNIVLYTTVYVSMIATVCTCLCVCVCRDGRRRRRGALLDAKCVPPFMCIGWARRVRALMMTKRKKKKTKMEKEGTSGRRSESEMLGCWHSTYFGTVYTNTYVYIQAWERRLSDDHDDDDDDSLMPCLDGWLGCCFIIP